jgi:FkbM family methyltransferase
MTPLASRVERLKTLGCFLWCSRSRFTFLNFAIPCRLADGSRFMAYGDAIGWSVFGSTLPFRQRSYETRERKFVSRFLKPGMTVFDVGANQGFYTLLAARAVRPFGKIYAFEPAATEVEKLKLNILGNSLTNVVIEQLAVGSAEGFSDFYMCLDGRGSFSSLRPPGEDVKNVRRKLTRVPVRTLDSYVRENQIFSLDFMKVDVEGGELEVFKGGRNVLTEMRPIIMCELADIRTRPWGYAASEIYNFLVEYGYIWFRPGPDGAPVWAAPKDSYDPDWENLVAIPRTKLDSQFDAPKTSEMISWISACDRGQENVAPKSEH